MATETTKHTAQSEAESRHSALEELYRDERRPALLLLSALVIAVIFFALGIMVGRWTMTNSSPGQSAQPAPAATPLSSNQPPATNSTNGLPSSNSSATANTAQDDARRYSLLIATFNSPAEAQPLIKRLEEAGYKDVRTSIPRANESPQRYSILVGHYTRDEAEQLATRLRSSGDARLRYVRVIEAASN
jgi:hypothetical protein